MFLLHISANFVRILKLLFDRHKCCKISHIYRFPELNSPVFTCTNVSATRIIITSLTLMQTILSINMLENIGKHDMRSEGKKTIQINSLRKKNLIEKISIKQTKNHQADDRLLLSLIMATLIALYISFVIC